MESQYPHLKRRLKSYSFVITIVHIERTQKNSAYYVYTSAIFFEESEINLPARRSEIQDKINVKVSLFQLSAQAVASLREREIPNLKVSSADSDIFARERFRKRARLHISSL